jgi:hypothetical protein
MLCDLLRRLQDVEVKLNDAKVAVNFSSTAESLSPARDVVDMAINSGLIVLVDESMKQLNNINKSITEATYDTTQEVKKQCKSAEDELESAMNDLNETIESMDFEGVKAKV